MRFTGVLLAFHSFHFRVHTRTCVTLLVLLAITTLALAEPPPRQLVQAAAEALRAGDPATARTHLERAAQLAPDYPRVHLLLARLHAAAGRMDDAFAALQALADMGLGLALADDPALTPLRTDPRFADLLVRFARNLQSRAAVATTDQTIPAVAGILESVAVHPATGERFFGDVRQRCIWARAPGAPAGALTRFSASADGLLGVFALKFSADGRTLWASCSAVPEMQGPAPSGQPHAFLAAYDMPTRRLRHVHPLPAETAEAVLGDFTLGADGTLYVTDSAAPVIWRLAPGAAELERWLSDGRFVSLQGITASADGRALYVADYARGIWRIDPATKSPTLLQAPAGSTLFGIDGLYATPGALLAVQNGVHPQRVLRVRLTPEGGAATVTVLAQDPAAMPDLGLGQVAGERFTFVTDSGWARFADPAHPPAPRSVIIRTLDLPAPAAP